MGFMIRVGMAIGGMLLSYFFGLNFLSNFATHLDSTGNVLVDIADGIELVSKGIEALETYIDPVVDSENGKSDQGLAKLDSLKPQPQICKKGKCTPYDPTKDKVLQQQLIQAERDRILQQFQSGSLPTEALVPAAQLFDGDSDPDEGKAVIVNRLREAAAGHLKKDKNKDPEDPKKLLLKRDQDKISSQLTKQDNSPFQSDLKDVSPWRFGTWKILSNLGQVCQHLNKLILKVVSRIFPWNQRAQRRLKSANGDEDG